MTSMPELAKKYAAPLTSTRFALISFFLAGCAMFVLSAAKHIPGLSMVYEWLWLGVWGLAACWAVWSAISSNRFSSIVNPYIKRAANAGVGLILAVACIGVGYKILPWTGESLWLLGTSSKFEGTVLSVHNDETATGGIRRTFSIQRHSDCVTGQYVSRDLVIPPWVSHDDSARTREAMVEGQSFVFSEAGTRRFKNDMPLIGNFLWIGYLADFSSWPIIYSADAVQSISSCEKSD